MKQEEKKVGIVTLHGYYNYGNKLQNYALKHILEKLDFDVTTTVISDRNLVKKMRIKLLIRELANSPGNKILSLFKNRFKKNETKINSVHNKREDKFRSFSERYLNEEFIELTDKSNLRLTDKYSYFVTGSDQVWNPDYFVMLPIYFLTFTERKKRIAYAPSISRNELPNKFKKDYKRWLEEMSAISIREKAGADIISNLTGIEAPVLVDPTMLLTKDEWLEISQRAVNRPDKPYMLTYFLGGPSDSTRKKLEEIAVENDMEIINLGDIIEEETYNTGPSEFIDYINNASAFFTDSFHGVVFSIILQTPFVVYERLSDGPSMYSRIETILENFNFKGRENKHFDEDIFTMDFSKTKMIWEREFRKSMAYLESELRIEGKQ